VQVLLHPTDTDTQPAYDDSRVAGRVDGKCCNDSAISTSARWLCRERWSSAGRCPRLWVPNTTSTHGARETTTSLSFCARHPPTAICMRGLTSFHGRRLPRVP